MAENYKKRYEEVKHMLEMYQDEIVPNLRKELDKRVNLVYCKDCIHDNMATCPLCWIENHTMQFVNHDNQFFCGFAERRNDDG